MDYKGYWTSQGLKHITAGNVQYPEGWNVVEYLKEFLSDVSYEQVLDLGCGFGRLCEAFPSDRYIGVDLNPGAIAEARRRNPDYEFEEVDITSGYPEADLAVAYTVFLHMDDTTLGSCVQRLNCNKLLIAEVTGREWRRPGNPPAFNRETLDYTTFMSKYDFTISKYAKALYKRYSENSKFRRRNTNIWFMLFERT